MFWTTKSQLERDLNAKAGKAMFLKRQDVAEIFNQHPNSKRVSRILKRAKSLHDFGSVYAIPDLAIAIWEDQLKKLT